MIHLTSMELKREMEIKLRDIYDCYQLLTFSTSLNMKMKGKNRNSILAIIHELQDHVRCLRTAVEQRDSKPTIPTKTPITRG